MKTIRTLEQFAIDAHRRGDRWADFWRQHGDDVRKAEPFDAGRFHALVRRLLAIVASGDDANVESLGEDMPQWECDDAKPADVGTKARCLIPLRESLSHLTHPSKAHPPVFGSFRGIQ